MTDDEAKKKLNAEQYRVMREKDTERPYSGKYWDNDENGVYACALCGNVLFASLSKFDAENGWPAFSSGLDEKLFVFQNDEKGEAISCKKCGGHLGYRAKRENGKSYFQINSAALEFQPIEIEIDDGSSQQQDDSSQNQPQSPQVSVTASASGLPGLLIPAGAALLGLLIGGGAGTLMCAPAPVPTQGAVMNTSATFTVTPAKPKASGTTMTTSVGKPTITESPAATSTPAPGGSASSSDGTI